MEKSAGGSGVTSWRLLGHRMLQDPALGAGVGCGNEIQTPGEKRGGQPAPLLQVPGGQGVCAGGSCRLRGLQVAGLRDICRRAGGPGVLIGG